MTARLAVFLYHHLPLLMNSRTCVRSAAGRVLSQRSVASGSTCAQLAARFFCAQSLALPAGRLWTQSLAAVGSCFAQLTANWEAWLIVAFSDADKSAGVISVPSGKYSNWGRSESGSVLAGLGSGLAIR